MIDFTSIKPDWEEYLESMSKDGVWADEIVVRGLAYMLEINIFIVTSSPDGADNQPYQWIVGDVDFQGTPLRLGHVWEYHYRSLGKFEWKDAWLFHKQLFENLADNYLATEK